MNPQEDVTQALESIEQPKILSTPFFKKRNFIILFILFLSLVTIFGVFVIIQNSTSPKKIITTITPTPVQYAEAQKTWQVNILYSPSSESFFLQELSLNEQGFKQNYTDVNSPYIFTVYDRDEKILYFANVPIATSIVIPDEFIDTPFEDSLKTKQLESSFQIPYFEKGVTFKIFRNDTVLIQGEFPESEISSIQEENENQLSTKIAQSETLWSLSATSICEDGKVFIKYDFNTTTPAVIFTQDVEDKNDPAQVTIYGSMDDNSWESGGAPLKLTGGRGSYVAKANLINWDPVKSNYQLSYNGPVGFLKGRTYLGTIQTSGDWTDECVDVGCVDGNPPESGYAETTVTTMSVAECPDKDVTSDPIEEGEAPNQICKPDALCSSGSSTLQICTFTCE